MRDHLVALARDLLDDLRAGGRGAYERAIRIRALAEAGDPLASAAWQTLMALYGQVRGATSAAPPEVLDMYERLSQGDPTSWRQLERLCALAYSGDKQCARMVAMVRAVHEDRKRAGGPGAPTTMGYSMPVHHRPGIAPPIIVGADFPAIPGLWPPPPGLWPPGIPLPSAVPALPAKIPDELILPLTEQVFETLLRLIRQAKVPGGGLDKASFVPMADAEPLGPMRATPFGQAYTKATQITPTAQRMTQVLSQPMHAPTTRILQKLTML